MSGSDREKWNKRYREGAYADRAQPSVFLRESIGQVSRGRALDVGCGAGRNALYLAQQGFEVDAVDISSAALARARRSAEESGLRVNWMEQDLEQAWVPHGPYHLILVVRYVNLPLVRQLLDSLAPGGCLICEQHLVSDAQVIGPNNPAYRVMPGELATTARGLKIELQEEGVFEEPDGRMAALSRLLARRL